MPNLFHSSDYAHFLYLDFDSLGPDTKEQEWLIYAMSEITGRLWTSGVDLSICQHDRSPSNRAIKLMFQARCMDNSMGLMRRLLSLVGRVYHELGHYFDLAHTYLGYERFYYGSGLMLDAVNVLSVAAVYELHPLEFCRLLRQGEHQQIVREKPPIYLDKFRKGYEMWLRQHQAVHDSLTRPLIFGYAHGKNSIWEFSALLREASAILQLFGKYPYEIYVADILAEYNDQKAIMLWNELLSSAARRHIDFTSEQFLKALEGCSLLVNLSMNGTTGAEGQLSDGPNYLECFYTYFYDWLNCSELNTDTCIRTIENINNECGYMGPGAVYGYLADYVDKHRASKIYKRNAEQAKGEDGGMFKTVDEHIRTVESEYIERFGKYEQAIWPLCSVYKFLRWPEAEWIPTVARNRGRVEVSTQGIQNTQKANNLMEVFYMSLMMNDMFFGDRSVHPEFFEGEGWHNAGAQMSPTTNPFF